MTSETVTLMVSGDGCRANVPATTRYQGTSTGGGRNTERHAVTIAGHELEGIWDNDARHNTLVAVAADHPLAEAVRLLAAMQDAAREQREMTGPVPAGWTRDDWSEACRQADAKKSRTASAAMSNPLARQLVTA